MQLTDAGVYNAISACQCVNNHVLLLRYRWQLFGSPRSILNTEGLAHAKHKSHFLIVNMGT